MTKRFDLLKNYEWLGEFWSAGNESTKWPGILSYSPKDGLVLNLARSGGSAVLGSEPEGTIFGITRATGPISLLECAPTGSGVASTWMAEDKIWASAAICGDHLDETTRFAGCSAELNNLSEFFHPQGFKLDDQYKSSPVLPTEGEVLRPAGSGDEPDFTVSIVQSARGALRLGKTSEVFLLDHDGDSELIQDINSALADVLQHHGRRHLSVKTDLTYALALQAVDAENGATFRIFRKVIYETCGLFSVLFLKTARPTSVTLQVVGERTKEPSRSAYPTLLSLQLRDRQLFQMKSDKDRHFSLPTTADAIRDHYAATMKSWFAFAGMEQNIILPAVLNHIVADPDAIQEFILLLAAIEQAALLDGGSHGSRYDWFLQRYAPEFVKNRFSEYLSDGPAKQSNGEKLSDIRHTIIHPRKLASQKFKWCGAVIKSTAIRNLCELIFVSLVNYIYVRIGLSESAVERFQAEIQRHVVTHVPA